MSPAVADNSNERKTGGSKGGGDDELEARSATTTDPLERLRIAEGLARLSDAHREVILAVHVQGRTYQELSDATGVPVATWRARAYHALRSMRGYLEGSEDPDAHSR